ncbi:MULTISPECIES: hypothetical protein [Chryseobacterium]|uniref:YtxH domain-containing protein n=1 Tax=Chryseobacterium piscium TaxID=333702 RepID=A0A3D9BUR0_9FLAO|nr:MULTISPECIES: hypothetical protein [Chryseobacterium]REC44949.1 hypothetical protein DRF69_03535 [Chryseobacterium sp. 5_R23647]REC57270.1 hypothetical protein DRF62_01705 [Chryseobacterium piscium]
MKKSLFVAAIAAISLVACKKGEATTSTDSIEANKDSVVTAIDSTKDAAVDSIKTNAEVATDSIKADAKVATEAVKGEAKKEEAKH